MPSDHRNAYWLAACIRLPMCIMMVSMLFLPGCSRQPAPFAEKKPETQPQAEKKERAKEPIVLRVAYEFEGIPETLFPEWVDGKEVVIHQYQIRLDIQGKPEKPADLYILSPRLITHFITTGLLATLPEDQDLRAINPTFTHHRFDPMQTAGVPWRWTPMVVLQRADVAGHGSLPVFPEDIVLLAGLEHPEGDFRYRKYDPEIYCPDPIAYKKVWDQYVSGGLPSLWIPAACPIRNLENPAVPPWKWNIPNNQTVILLDHLALSAQTDQRTRALSLINHLITPSSQKELPRQTGYFPVISYWGRELQDSPIPLPNHAWLSRSIFLDLPAWVVEKKISEQSEEASPVQEPKDPARNSVSEDSGNEEPAKALQDQTVY
ncbi:MAG: hypothetical protein ACFCUX_00200 [Candidatus Methylacidiphilales bacterium]